MSDISKLAETAAKGDKSAFDSLYERTRKGVWFTCISLLRNEENAKDIMQETYITAFEKLPLLTDFGGIQSWLNKIAANKCKNYIRAKGAPIENSEELLENIPDDNLIPEEYVTDMEKRRIIADIIERSLSEAQYRTVILYYFDEMTAAEIAELMGCHEKTVLYRLKTARLKIKEEVMRYEKENNDKLHAVVPVPILTRLFRLEAENISVPNVPVRVRASSNAQNGVPSNSAASAAKQGGKKMLNSLKSKIIAGACAAVVVGGGVAAGVIISNNSNNSDKKPAAAVTSTAASSSKTESAPKPAEQSQPEVSEGNSAASEANSGANAAEGDFEYAPLKHKGNVDNDAVMITKYNGSGGRVELPSTLGGKPVKKVDGFSGNKNITDVIVPEGVLYIDMLAFSRCKSLEKVELPSTLLEIGQEAFKDCEKLESINIPDSVITVYTGAFSSCDSLKKIVLPDGLQGLGKDTFKFSYDCEVHFNGKVYNKDNMDELEQIFEDKSYYYEFGA